MSRGVYLQGFRHYVHKVVERLQRPSSLIDEEDLISNYNDEEVLAAICMRATCSTILETLILLDR